MGLDFPNLPYWVEGDFKITESSAIEDYIVRSFDKNGKLSGGNSIKLNSTISMIVSLIRELLDDIVTLCFNPNF